VDGVFEPAAIAKRDGCVCELSGRDCSACASPVSSGDARQTAAASAASAASARQAFVTTAFGSPIFTEAVVASPAYVTVVFETPVLVAAAFVYTVRNCQLKCLVHFLLS